MEKTRSLEPVQAVDQESEVFLNQLAEQEQVLKNRLEGVKVVLIVLSARGMAYDMEALRQKVVFSYPEAAVFFLTTAGKPIGPSAPAAVVLLLDFTGPKQRQSLFFAKKMKRSARLTVGRNAGLFRKKIYDRVFDETLESAHVPTEMLERERFVQKKLMNLAGVVVTQMGDTPPDRGKTIALELPGMQRL